jgi:small subunit ribosomal protein S18
MQDEHDEFRVPRELDGQEKGPRRTSKRIANRLGLSRDHRFDYKNTAELRYFITERGKLVPARVSGLSARQQRDLSLAVKRARNIALLPFTKGQP